MAISVPLPLDPGETMRFSKSQVRRMVDKETAELRVELGWLWLIGLIGQICAIGLGIIGGFAAAKGGLLG